jgi:Fe-S-cluster-containing dehydrogenase component
MGAGWNMVIDVSLCENCNNCVLATKDELVGNTFEGFSAPHASAGEGVLRIERHVRGQAPMVDVAYVPRMCNHCDNAPCVQAGRGAVRKREDGIVIFDPVLARGRRDLVDSCPYGAVAWNEELQLPQTWFFDAHLLDAGWKEPRCAGACPTRAIEVLKLDDAVMQAKAQTEKLRVLSPGLGHKPRIFYRNLHRADTCFIGGSVTARIGQFIECVAGALVELRQCGQTVATTSSDTFGDFKFDGLAPGSGEVEVLVHHPEHGQASVTARLEHTSVVLQAMCLSSH